MNDNPYKARLSVFSQDASQITGFNVSVKGLKNPHYYNVPVVEQESADSTRTIYIGFDPAEDELELPLTFELVIQPHGSDGIPLDETSTPVTIEESSSCPITTENTYYWQWLYTMYSYPGDNLEKLTAPWFSATYSEDAKGGYYYGKCCVLQNGIYGEIYLGDRGCTQQSPNYKEMFITSPYSLIPYEYLLLFEGQSFILYNASFNVNFSPQKSSMCNLRAYYNKTYTDYAKTGSYTLVVGNAKKLTAH